MNALNLIQFENSLVFADAPQPACLSAQSSAS